MTDQVAEHSQALLPSQACANPKEQAESDEGAGFPIVGVGASAGGLDAFTQLLKSLPADTGMAFVLVQHLAPTHASALAEILARAATMPVTEVHDGAKVEPNQVYVIPPGQNMIITRGELHLIPRLGHGIHRPVDQFFRSLAEDQRHLAIGVVLSGTATDGTLGLEAIKAEGGITFAQDATALHEGMPHSAIASGCVDFVRSPVEIAREIVRIGKHPYTVPEVVAEETGDKPNLIQVVKVLHDVTGVDFTHYKFNTLYRRVTRRMVFSKMDGLAEYVQHLRQTPAEVQALYQDILINVTNFFRDPESFEALKDIVFPRLLKNRSRHDPVRLWTLGCSTGQEAYSLAMAFTEVAEAAGSSVPFQLFATDLNPAGIEKARAGIYPKDIDQDVSPERLQRFFTEVDGGYRICKSIRDACIFSRHNVLADPPFSRIDLISCRNLLIYLEPVLQQRIVPTLHYALKPAGCLWLGGSETIGSYRNLFEAEDSRHKIYIKKSGSSSDSAHFVLQSHGVSRSPFIPLTGRSSDAWDLPREADRVLLTRFAPPGVLVSSELEILQYRGDIGPYLSPAPGKASLSLLKMLREGLLVGVRGAVVRAGKEQSLVREEGLRVKTKAGYQEVTIEVIPIKGHDDKEGGFLILFEDGSQHIIRDLPATSSAEQNSDSTAADNARLAQELAATREYLQSVIEQQEAANEELQSASEEVQSANEELQSTNEELETSKEEIQSSNEELATVNDELNNRLTELHRVNNDLINLIGSVQMAIVMLGPDLRVRRFTPLAEKLLNLIPTDVGRPLADIKLILEGAPDLEPLLSEVLNTVIPQYLDVQDKQGRWYSLRLRPYKTTENKIDGVVVMLVDIDLMKTAHAKARESDARYRALFESAPMAVFVCDSQAVIQQYNRHAAELWGREPECGVERHCGSLRLWAADGTRFPHEQSPVLDVLRTGAPVHNLEVVIERPDGSRLPVLVNIAALKNAEDEITGSVTSFIDITERKQTEAALQISEVRHRRLFETSKDGILILDGTSQKITHVNPFLATLLDYPSEYFLGKELWEIGFLRDKEASRSAMQQLADQESVRYETLPLEDRVGKQHPVEMVANAYEEGGQRFIQCNVRDISERSLLERLLRGQASELSDLHRRKDEFLAMLSHELRSPLAPIANALQLLGLQRGNENRMQQQARGIIERQLGQLQHLVDDLLEVSRITTGRVQLRREPVLVGDIVAAAVETVRPLMVQRRHEFTVSLPPDPIWLNADAARLEQVMVNLLTNAAKYTEDGGHVWLTVELAIDADGSDEGREVIIRIRDSGVGIAMELLPKIFDLFTQADRSLDRSQGGLGIGLALVRRLTELHGGKVEAHSSLGQGSEFVVRLPVTPIDIPQPKLQSTEATQPKTRPLRVLIVDDNADTVLSFSILLKALGHDVKAAHDGPTGVEAALAYKPDVALLDIGLPGLSGYEVAKRIRQQPDLQNVVLVALTGYGQQGDREASRQAGFSHHMVKPANFEKLEEILAAASEQST